MERFAESKDFIREAVNRYAEGIKVKSTKPRLNKNLQRVMEEPYYSEDKNIIYMDENEDDYEYAETFKHEMGHFVDCWMGKPSFDDDFSNAIEADKSWFLSESYGTSTFESMLEELKLSPAIDNRNLSDIYSAYLCDSPGLWKKAKNIYYSLGVAVYGHDDSYWKEITGPAKAIEGEVFAELFAIYAENDAETVRFVEKWFPNVSRKFKLCMATGERSL